MVDQKLNSLPDEVRLRDIITADLPVFFAQQQDPEANYMAAFTAEDPGDRTAFMAKWTKILGDDGIRARSILYDGQLAGYIAKFEQFGEPEVSYWIGRAFWRRGVATRALALFLNVVQERPLFARAAKDNIGSLRVLQKNGFLIVGEGKGYANARGAETEEYILKCHSLPDGGSGHIITTA